MKKEGGGRGPPDYVFKTHGFYKPVGVQLRHIQRTFQARIEAWASSGAEGT